MKHSPRRPKRNVNVSEPASYRHFFQFAFLLTLVIGTSYFVVGLILDMAIPLVSLERERAIFGTSIPQLIGTPLSNHPDHSLLKKLAERFSSLTPEADFDFTPTIVKATFPNAFALPGGTILFTDKLLEMLPSDEAKAFVLAHEMGHVLSRHVPRRIAGTVLWGLLSGLVWGDASSLSSATTSAFTLNELRHSRKAETQADQLAIDLLAQTFGRIDGAFDTFTTLRSITADSGAPSIEMLQTHPLTEHRIEEVKSLALTRGYRFQEATNSSQSGGARPVPSIPKTR